MCDIERSKRPALPSPEKLIAVMAFSLPELSGFDGRCD
jgi:hypothetical protein